ncbi:cobalt ECF transporter T component CbiQ [Alisedimentitalea sp. MJ-SS2]|uniref:cobalt ECF transporter T component CbiQ n=1 Tax=Aliisedimentitalea sp. MJ-SS2 TaxID=3049795 RepID=UPI002911B01D|nr:cobalt ECF transporter T component CbiQ [Alisedimentitalea sp. MJ-SS2]MDU8927541.1 cobalt ECF transporter T component CbiQ [Alisedimentitalea sp. MJ-SS2]
MADVLTSALAVRSGPGWLTRIDPRYRIVAVVVFALICVALSSLAALVAAMAVALGLMVAARLPAGPTLKRMAAVDGFILFLLVMLPFTTPGETLFTVAGFEASREGLLHAIEIALTANAVILSLMALVGTLEPVVLGHALHALKVPERLVHLMMFTIRYLSVLHEEYLRMRAAMKARGFRPSTSLHTLRSFGYLVGMMLVRAIERSERIMAAMKCRGFAGRFPMLEQFSAGPRDRAFAVGFAVLMLALIAIGWVDVAY